MNPKYIWGLIGLGIGAAGGYFFAKHQFEKKHEDYIHEKVQEGIEGYILATESDVYGEPEIETSGNIKEASYNKESTESETIDYASFYQKPSPKELIRMANQQMAESEHPEDSGEDTEFESQEEKDERLDAEIQGDKKMHKEPYEIDEDTAHEDSHYDKETLFWYDNDNTLAIEAGEPIENPTDLIGDYLNVFDDPTREFVIVRNPKMRTDYTIIRLFEAYADQLNSDPDWAD